MALSANFSFTNKTAASKQLSYVNLDPVTDYGLTHDEPDRVSLTNKTATIDQPELITYQADRVGNVNSYVPNPNPPKTKEVLRYGVRVDELLRVTSSDNDNYVVDYPIVMNLTVKHAANNLITASMIEQVFQRLLGTLVRDDGSYRFDDLMRHSLRPTNN